MNDTLDRIRTLMATEFGLPMDALGPDKLLVDLGVDSLAALEFAFRLEDAFDIRLDSDADLRGARIADLVRAVESARSAASAPAAAV